MTDIRVVDISDSVLRLGYFARHGLWLAVWVTAVAFYAVLVVAVEWITTLFALDSDAVAAAIILLPALLLVAAVYAAKAHAKRRRLPWPRLFRFDAWDRPFAVTGVDAVRTLDGLEARARRFPRRKYLLKPRRPVLAAVLMLAAFATAVLVVWALFALYSSSDEARSLLKLGLEAPYLRELIAGAIAIVPVALGYLALSWLAADASHIVSAEAGAYFVLLRAFSRDEFSVREPEVRALGIGFDESRLEDVVARPIKRVAALIAIGNPAEQLPALGANRAYFTDADWRQQLEQWLAKAGGAVVLLGGSTLLEWEIARLRAFKLIERSIFFFPDAATLDETLAKLAQLTGHERLASACASACPFERRILALVPAADGAHTIVVSKSEFRSDYELACKLCLAVVLQSQCEAVGCARWPRS